MKLRGMLSACSLCLILAACGERTQPPASGATPTQGATAAPDTSIRVALIMKAKANPFFMEMEKGARRAQQEAGIELEVMSTQEETAIEEQVNLVDAAVNDRVKAIVIAPVDSRRLVPALKKAQDAGIKIIDVDNRLDAAAMQGRGLAVPPFISIDNERAAYESARYVANLVNAPTEAAIFEGIRQAANANERKQGAERAFGENHLISITVKETANWSADEAYAVAKRVFLEHPKLGVVFCANDMMAMGLIKYLKEAKRHNVRIASFDDLEEARRAIRSGDLAVTVDQQADKQGYEGVMAALQAVRGKPLPPEIRLDAALVNAETLKLAR